MHGLLMAVACLVVEFRGEWSLGTGASGVMARALEHSSIVVGHGLSCSEAFVIFSQQRLNPCPLHLAGGFFYH